MDYSKLTKKELISIIQKQDEVKKDQTRDAFISNISHDVRTLLHAIYGNAQILNNADELNTKSKKSVQRILDASSHMIDLLNDIINISSNGGDKKIILTNFLLKDFLNNIYTIFHSFASSKKIDLKLNNEFEDDYVLKTDKNKLFYILLNLIGNAIKYTKEGSVTLSCKSFDEEMLFEIIDTGIGIEKKMLSKILDDYIRVENSAEDGTGLGLGIANKNIKLLGSKLKIQSQINKGSCFSFSIKCAKNSKSFVSTQDEIFHMEEILAPKRPEKFRVLVYANNENEIDILKSYFYSRNINYDSINELDSLDIKIKEYSYAMVLIDANSLDEEELSLLKKCRKKNEKMPFIALTSLVMSNELFKLNELFTNYIVEPYNFVDLDQVLIMFSNDEFFFKEKSDEFLKSKIVINNEIKNDIIKQANVGNYNLCQDLIYSIKDKNSKELLLTYLESYDFDKIVMILNQKESI